MNIYSINVSELPEKASMLNVFDKVYLTGDIYTARDAAHKKIMELISKDQPLPFELKGACIYYAGPTPAPNGMVIGSCGPTTSGRMDTYSPKLLDLGLTAMIGKGQRNREVRSAIVRNKALYLCAIGGAGALASQCIKSCEEIAFKELGCESIKKLHIEDFPLTVAIDTKGHNIFELGKRQYLVNVSI